MKSADMGSFEGIQANITMDPSGNTMRRVLVHQAHPTVYVTRSGDMFVFGPVDSKVHDRFNKHAPTCNAWIPIASGY